MSSSMQASNSGFFGLWHYLLLIGNLYGRNDLRPTHLERVFFVTERTRNRHEVLVVSNCNLCGRLWCGGRDMAKYI